MKNQKGFTLVEGLLLVLVLGVLGFGGFYVWNSVDKQSESSESTSQNSSKQKNEPSDEASTQEYPKYEGLSYATPGGWTEAKNPYGGDEEVGKYLLSPDYETADVGQLVIKNGAYITFSKSTVGGATEPASASDMANELADGTGYYDNNSVEVTSIAGVDVVRYNSGHTTDNVTITFKNASDEWIEVIYSTSTREGGGYNANESEHYETFQAWLVKFVESNS